MKISGCSPKTARRAVIKSALRVEHERESEWKDEGKKRMMIKTGAKKEERNNIHRRVPRSSLSLSFFVVFYFQERKTSRVVDVVDPPRDDTQLVFSLFFFSFSVALQEHLPSSSFTKKKKSQYVKTSSRFSSIFALDKHSGKQEAGP